LFGTDQSFGRPELVMPHQGFLKGLVAEGKISGEVYEKIAWKNATRLLGL